MFMFMTQAESNLVKYFTLLYFPSDWFIKGFSIDQFRSVPIMMFTLCEAFLSFGAF